MSGRLVPAGEVIALVCERLGMEPSEITGPGQTQKIAYARHVVEYLLRKMSGKSFPAVARAVGRRDHTSAIYAVRKLEAERGVLQETMELLHELEAKLA